MRVGAGGDVVNGKYRITWEKAFDSSAIGYGELKDVYVNVLEPSGDIPITVDPIPDLKVGDTSVEIWITLGAYITDPLYFNLAVEDEYEDMFTITPSRVEFQNKDIRKSFTITVKEFVARPNLTILADGFAIAAFDFPRPTVLPFFVTDEADSEAP